MIVFLSASFSNFIRNEVCCYIAYNSDKYVGKPKDVIRYEWFIGKFVKVTGELIYLMTGDILFFNVDIIWF